MINKSFQIGIFPEKLKIANIIPIHKGGKADAITNYKLISILPCMSKIYERATYNRVMEFLVNNQILLNYRVFPSLHTI